MTAEHNHPPRCCCMDVSEAGVMHATDIPPCPACPEHGTFAAAATVECPQCHQPAGRPHTDFCTLAPGKVWDGVLPRAADSGTIWAQDPAEDYVAQALDAVNAGNAGSWPTVAGYLADEVRRLRQRRTIPPEWIDPNTCPHTVTEYDDQGCGTCRRCGIPAQ